MKLLRESWAALKETLLVILEDHRREKRLDKILYEQGTQAYLDELKRQHDS